MNTSTLTKMASYKKDIHVKRGGIELDKCIYTQIDSKTPYPRVQYKASCGLYYVETEGYKFEDDGFSRTCALNITEKNCFKCGMPIGTNLDKKEE
jgi:hypothetical protein